MRKYVLFLIMAICLLFSVPALAQTETFDVIAASCEIPDSYILLTPDNLPAHPEWVANRGETVEALQADWAARGVLLQAWTQESDVCIEISAVQDEDAQALFDIDQQTAKTRSTYRSGYLKKGKYVTDGYTWQFAEWKKTSNAGRFLMLKYKRTSNGETYRGYARRTIRNGYTITIDYQVHGRSLKNADSKALSGLMTSWSFSTVKSLPAEAATKAVFTSEPPMETSTGKFSVEGTCDPGMHLIGVVMRMASPDPIRYEATASKTGKFSIDVELPSEGVWLMTLTIENGETVTEEIAFQTTTYKKSLLTINFDADVPVRLYENGITSEAAQKLTGDTLVISGKTLKNTTVQCLVNDQHYSKKTNGTGVFSFKIPTAEQGDYDITLVFEKRNYSTRRFTAIASRELTEEDVRRRAKEEAVKPAYSTLTKKLAGYTGRTMGYDLYITNIEQAGDEWVIFAAMRSTKTGYKDVVVVTTKEEPNLSLDSKHKMYGTCVGSYQVLSEENGDKSYPCFELLFWE